MGEYEYKFEYLDCDLQIQKPIKKIIPHKTLINILLYIKALKVKKK